VERGYATGVRPQTNGPRGSDLAALILDECARTNAPVGGRLPTERQYAAAFGVTRAAVRRALALLEAGGHVSREVGRGTFLLETATTSPDASVDGNEPGAVQDAVGPADVMAARELFEIQVLPLVIAHATGRDFAELDRCLRAREAADSPKAFDSWDDAFHRAIVAATHNELLLRMYAPISAARSGPLWGSLKQRQDTPERRALYHRQHLDIVDALRARELDRAREATRVHLESVRRNLLGPATSDGRDTAPARRS
jgi:GntR family transcriptional regulator, uxu operon transcriptional repressor